MHPVRLPLSLRLPLLATLLLFCGSPVIAQSTGEWTTVWLAPSNNVADFTRHVSSAGRGHYLMTSGRDIYRSTDGGGTWTSIATHNSLTSRFGAVEYPSLDRIVVMIDSTVSSGNSWWYHGRLLASTDGGATWIAYEGGGEVSITAISMFDGSHGIAGLSNLNPTADSLLRTTDGGVTWRGVALPDELTYPDAVFAIGPSEWAARMYDPVSESTHIVRTADAGATWTRTPLPASVYSLAFVGARTVFAAGGIRPSGGAASDYRDIIKRSTDGGVTWTTVLDSSLEWTSGLNDIAFADELNGIAAGRSGQMYRTTDGGNTWERQWIPTDRITEYTGVRELAYPVADEAIGVSGNFGAVAYHGRRTLIFPTITAPASSNTPRPLELTVSWSRVEGATAYDIQIADTIYQYDMVNHRYFDEPYFEREGLTDTTVSLTLTEHRRFIIRVRARNATMVGDWSRRVYIRTIGEAKVLATPSIISPSNGATNQPLELDLVWSAVPSAVGYEYRVAYEPTYLWTHVDEEHHIGTTARITQLSPQTEYYVRVRARDADGELSDWDYSIFYTGAVSSVDGDVRIEVAASLRPNIASDRTDLHLSLARAGTTRIRVVDATGSDALPPLERELDAGAHVLPIDASSLVSGRYDVLVVTGQSRVTMGLIVVR